ncbi:TetR/AcrR family transcriptional regulator [Labrys okinawensis]|uniref:TetR/AcrR family transcriptional regulator n=1 Tax=Labrys okinawensis TaxID=346911 RepID=UPI0039BD2794
MRQNQLPVKRQRGRPQIRSDEETRHLVIEAAAKEFQVNGYAGTSMSAVAQRAGVSTKTMYRLIPTKAEMFSKVVADRIHLFMLVIDDEALDLDGLVPALERILIAYGKLTLSEETIALNRLVIGESDRFPEIGNVFYETAVMRTNAAIETWLRRQAERGLIELPDPQAATGMLRGMMIMEIQRAVMLGRRNAPDEKEIAYRARLCAKLFLRGCCSKMRV